MRSNVRIGIVMLLMMAGCAGPQEPEPVVQPEREPLISGVADSIYQQAQMPERLTFGRGTEGASDSDFVLLADVVPDVIQEIRYYTTFNFVGRRIPGYEAPVAILTRRAADSLRAVSDELVAQGYRLKVFDAYRPQRAVMYFIGWARQSSDTLMRRYFYPRVPKDSLFVKGYLSSRSAHARGSTVDLTLFDMQTEREVDMGGTYDMLDTLSQFTYRDGLTREQLRHRLLLREAMMRHGFKPVRTEWWHFQLRDEPYPSTSFDFVICGHNGP